MHFVVTTYRHHRYPRPAPQLPQGADLEARSFGMVLDDPEGFVRTEQMTLGSSGAIVSRLSSTAYLGRMRDDTHFTFVMQRVGRYDLRIGGRDYSMSPGGLLAFRPNERRTRISPGKDGVRAAATLQLSIARMDEIAQAIETTTHTAFPRDGIVLHGTSGPTLAQVLPRLADDLFLRPSAPLPVPVEKAVCHLIDELVCDLIGRAVAQSSSRRVFAAFHRVRQAEEIMYAGSDEPFSMLDLASALGVGLRSLQLAFNEVHGGLSPRDVLNRIRLEKARERLLAAERDHSVTTIAMDSGFFHLSRFAQAYRRTYGERPSDTLLKRRN